MTYNNSPAKSATKHPTPLAAVASIVHAPLALLGVAAEPVAEPVPLPLGDPDEVEEPPEEVELAVEVEFTAAITAPPMIAPGMSVMWSALAAVMKESMVSFWGLFVISVISRTSRSAKKRIGRVAIRIDNANHASSAVGNLRTVIPDGVGIVDGDRKGRVRRALKGGEVAGENTVRRRVAWFAEAGLRNRMVSKRGPGVSCVPCLP